jgi:hypothetical protein
MFSDNFKIQDSEIYYYKTATIASDRVIVLQSNIYLRKKFLKIFPGLLLRPYYSFTSKYFFIFINLF